MSTLSKAHSLLLIFALAGLAACLKTGGSDGGSLYRGSNSRCNNDKREGREVCDGQDLDDKSCEDVGFGAGSLGCLADCSDFDRSGCTAPELCDNQEINPPEICDGQDLGGASCSSLGLGSGDLACLSNCGGYDTSGCESPCSGELTRCGDSCVDTTGDEDHCGSCDRQCNSNQTCQDSDCVTSTECSGSLTRCGQDCVDTTDDQNNCGSCGRQCQANQTCRNSDCVNESSCSGNLTLCGADCVDTSDNPQHCGSCSRRCDPGQVCESSDCVAGPDCRQQPCSGLTYCDLGSGNCLPGCISSDQCGGNEYCDMGSHDCKCETGYHRCGGVCVSDSSSNSCGSRCDPCPTPANGTATCTAGSCGISCNTGYRNCGGVCSQCPSSATSTSCDGSACVATACSGAKLPCGGVCLQCPADSQVSAWRCVNNACAAASCIEFHTPCGSNCCAWSHQVIHNYSDTYTAHEDMDVDNSDVAHVVVSEPGTVWYGASDNNFAMSAVPLNITMDTEYYTLRPDNEAHVAIQASSSVYIVRSYRYTHHFTDPYPGSRGYESLAKYKKVGQDFEKQSGGYSASGVYDLVADHSGSGLNYAAALIVFDDYVVMAHKTTGSSYDDERIESNTSDSSQLVATTSAGSTQHTAYVFGGSIRYSAYTTYSEQPTTVVSPSSSVDSLSIAVYGGQVHIAYATYSEAFYVVGSGESWTEQSLGEMSNVVIMVTGDGVVQVVGEDGTGRIVRAEKSGAGFTTKVLLSAPSTVHLDLKQAELSSSGTLHLLLSRWESSSQLQHASIAAADIAGNEPQGPDGGVSGDGGSSTEPNASQLNCQQNYLGVGDGCDCGCLMADSDCSGSAADNCQYCYCGSSTSDCDGIDPNDITQCL